MSKKNKQITLDEGIAQMQKPNPMEITDMQDGRRRIRVQFDLTYYGHPGKTSDGVSQTEPDMTLRLGQLLENHSRGGAVPMKAPMYFDTEIPTFSDLTDVDRYATQLKARLAETEKFIADEKAAALQAAKNKTNESDKKNEAEPKNEA